MGVVALLALILLSFRPAAAETIVEEVDFPLEVDGKELRLVGTVIRPLAEGRHPMVVLSHGAWGPAERRRAVPRMDHAPLGPWLAERGFAVLVPMRRGYGASEGEMAESSGGCADPDYVKSALASADDILAGARWLAAQPFADAARLVLIGFSAGGWGTLGAASLNPPGLIGVVNLAGGRGACSGNGWPGVWERMVEAARGFGGKVTAPSLWLYGRNDALFGPDFATRLVTAWREGGGPAEFEIIAPERPDGHGVFLDTDGIKHWEGRLERFLATILGAPAATATPRR